MEIIIIIIKKNNNIMSEALISMWIPKGTVIQKRDRPENIFYIISRKNVPGL